MSDQAQVIPICDTRPLSGSFVPHRLPAQSKQDINVPDVEPTEGDANEPAVDLHAIGIAEGQRLAQAAFDVERAQLEALIAAANALQPEASEELAVLIAETVVRLVGEITGIVELDHRVLLKRAHDAAAMIAECDAARTLWAHPADVPVLERARLGLDVKPDPNAKPGSLRIDCSSSWIEHGTALYIEELRTQLGLNAGTA